MPNEPKFYPIDALNAYPEAVGTLDQIEQSDGALWVHLNGKRSKLVGLQSLAFLIGQLEQIRAQVFGTGAPVARYVQHWNMQESYPDANGEWVKVADHFAAVAELGQALHDADKWESLYRNEHAACTRLLDTMAGYKKQRDDLQKRLTGPVAIAMPDLETEFPTWWDEHGQYVRAGGGSYERTFAYRAYESALAKVAGMNTTGADE